MKKKRVVLSGHAVVISSVPGTSRSFHKRVTNCHKGTWNGLTLAYWDSGTESNMRESISCREKILPVDSSAAVIRSQTWLQTTCTSIPYGTLFWNLALIKRTRAFRCYKTFDTRDHGLAPEADKCEAYVRNLGFLNWNATSFRQFLYLHCEYQTKPVCGDLCGEGKEVLDDKTRRRRVRFC